jgi:hypothetical protein
MSPDVINKRLKQFQQKFGETALDLASHAALPVVLNSELVHLLRINFFDSKLVDDTIEADLLLSSLCREIGEDLYEIDPSMRKILLQRLNEKEGHQRIKEIATLLLQYTERFAPWRIQDKLQQAQLLTALNFLDYQKATEWFQKVEASYQALSSGEREWFVAMKNTLRQQLQLIEGEQQLDIFEFEVVTVNARG